MSVEILKPDGALGFKRLALRDKSVDYNIDVHSPTYLSGWAWRPRVPDLHLQLELLSDGRVIAETKADIFRPDRAEWKKNEGFCGFAFKLRELPNTTVAGPLQLRVKGSRAPFWSSAYGRKRPGKITARCKATARVLERAMQARITTGAGRAMPFAGGMGYIDHLHISGGRTHIAGWTKARLLDLRTERGTRRVAPSIARPDVKQDHGLEHCGFDVSIPGVNRLEIHAGGECLLDVSPHDRKDRLRAWFRTSAALARVPLVHGRDLLAYALLGDDKAGKRLEELLVPAIDTRTYPVADGPIFGQADVPAITEPVDIVIPVYNAAEDLESCLDRLARHTNRRHRVILIDDCSTDLRVTPLLAAFVERWPGADLIRTDSNQGFIGAVNLGLSKAWGHVVLLNTDAFVPEDWLERLMWPILEHRDIASVTPMTNDGETVNVPIICRPASLAAGDADRIDAAARAFDSRKVLVDMPSGVGFCMAMSRSWLDRIPRLDTSFGRGYGEEVDWCRRTTALGGRHVMNGGLFVEHRGGRSFGAEKEARIRTNNRLIESRYPGHDASVQQFIATDPAIAPRLALALATAGLNGHVPFFLAHRLGGGAEHWLSDEIARLIAGGRPAAVLRDGETSDRVLIEVHFASGMTRGEVPLDELENYISVPPQREIVYSVLVGARDPLALMNRVMSTLGADDRVRMLFHDFFPLCPSYSLLNSEGVYCHLPDSAACQACYGQLGEMKHSYFEGERPALIAEWRREWRRFAERAERIEVFSNSSRDIVLSVWPELAERVVLRPHSPAVVPRKVSPRSDARPVLGVLGAIGYPKGAAVLRELAGVAGEELPIVVIGDMDPTYAHPGIRIHGPFRREEISDLAETYAIDRWLIGSIWPETFSFTTRECLATGLPVFCFDLGAQAEAVRKAPNGVVLPLGRPVDDLLAELLREEAVAETSSHVA